jgi:arsenate reductase
MTLKSMISDKEKILFLCFHNSARSQMAEGLLRALYGDKYEVYSAGVEASHVDSHALKVLSEISIDIFGQYSKSMNEYRGILFDMAVTVCDKAKEACPIWGKPRGSCLSSGCKKGLFIRHSRIP